MKNEDNDKVKSQNNSEYNISEKSKKEIQKGYEYLLKQVNKAKPLTQEQKQELEKYVKEAFSFDEVIESIDISGEKYKVIFTDGEEQLVYDNGEFFIISSVDSKIVKAKKKRNEARNIYIEYFIKYQLNPIIEQKNRHEKIKIISGVNKEPKLKNKNSKNLSEKEKLRVKEEKTKTTQEEITKVNNKANKMKDDDLLR